jgi:hypothetical protein
MTGRHSSLPPTSSSSALQLRIGRQSRFAAMIGD